MDCFPLQSLLLPSHYSFNDVPLRFVCAASLTQLHAYADAGGGEDRYFDSLIFLRELRWMASRVELSLHIFFIL